jgi:hypothetical protein
MLPSFVLADDVNNDAIVDLIVANSDEGSVSILFGKGDGTFKKQTRSSFNVGALALALGHLNDDTKLDLVVVNVHNTITIILNSCSQFLSFLTDCYETFDEVLQVE